MASQLQSARHVIARNTILLWLASVILIAGVGILVTYDTLRSHSVRAVKVKPAPLMSKRDSTKPVRAVEALIEKTASKQSATTDSAADIAAAHQSAVAAAVAGATEPASPPAPATAE